MNEDVQLRQYLMCGETAQVKLKNVVPHDIGDPGEGYGWSRWGMGLLPQLSCGSYLPSWAKEV